MTGNPETTSAEEPAPILAAFRRALARELHVLRRQPGLLWQQLYNRLQWEDEPVRAVLRPEFERRSVPGASPWLRNRTRLRESEALVRTLQGHGRTVEACAFSADGARVVSAGVDGTLKLWDAETGEEFRTLEGHTSFVWACAFSPDGARVVSASRDATLKLWDAETGQEVRTFAGHWSWVQTCAFSPDGAVVVSGAGFGDHTLKLWDAETGECLATLPLLGEAEAAAHHPHRASVACGDEGGSVYLVDLVGVTMGPLIVTAVDLGGGPAVRCPVCLGRHPLQEAWLGREMNCPASTCSARWRVNPFIARRRATG